MTSPRAATMPAALVPVALGTVVALTLLLASCGSPPRLAAQVRTKADGRVGPGHAVMGAVTRPERAPGDLKPTVSALVRPYLPRIPRFARAPDPAPVQLPGAAATGWYTRIPTTQPVAFITIDDGWTKPPVAPELLKAAHVPVTLFLTVSAVQDDPAYFRKLQAAGAVIEAHTINHPHLRGMSYSGQKYESCRSADQLGGWYGRRPVLFRPPYGEIDDMTLGVVHDCGMAAAFMWSETVTNGVVAYQVGHTVRPGDILLMHFRPTFAADFLAALNAIRKAGLTPALLEDYVR